MRHLRSLDATRPDATISSRQPRRGSRRAIAILAGGVAALGVAAPVAAQPLEQARFHHTGSEFWEDACGDLDVTYSFDNSGSSLGTARGRDGLIHFRVSVSGTNAFTNMETGRSFTQVFNRSDGDLIVTDNGDGTLTITTQEMGSDKWYDGDGHLVLMHSGLFRWQFLVDNAGTPTDPFDDEEIDFLGFLKTPQQNDWEGRDFCDALIEFTS
jgi:hypothetical protein